MVVIRARDQCQEHNRKQPQQFVSRLRHGTSETLVMTKGHQVKDIQEIHPWYATGSGMEGSDVISISTGLT